MGLKFRNVHGSYATGMVNPPLAPWCVPGDVPWCVVAGCRPMPSLQSGCSCEPVIYFHLAVLARSLKENPMTIARAQTRGTEKRKGKEREVNTCTKARLCIGRKDVERRVVFFIRPATPSGVPTSSFW